MLKKRIQFVIAPAASLMLLLSVAGCPGTTPAPTPTPNDNANDDPAPTGASFSGDVEPIFTSICGTCHTDGGVADLAGIALRLDGSDDFNAVFNDSSGDFKFIVAGDADNSLVYLRVSQDNPPGGSRMPLAPIPALTDEQQEAIRQWIDEGAEDN